MPFTMWGGKLRGFETEQVVLNKAFWSNSEVTSLQINWKKDDGATGSTTLKTSDLATYLVAANGTSPAGGTVGAAAAGCVVVPKSVWQGHLVSIALRYNWMKEQIDVDYDPADPTTCTFASDAAVALQGSTTLPGTYPLTATFGTDYGNLASDVRASSTAKLIVRDARPAVYASAVKTPGAGYAQYEDGRKTSVLGVDSNSTAYTSIDGANAGYSFHFTTENGSMLTPGHIDVGATMMQQRPSSTNDWRGFRASRLVLSPSLVASLGNPKLTFTVTDSSTGQNYTPQLGAAQLNALKKADGSIELLPAQWLPVGVSAANAWLRGVRSRFRSLYRRGRVRGKL